MYTITVCAGWGNISRGTGPTVEWEMTKKKLREIKINTDWCKGCVICIELCPKQVLELDENEKAKVVRPEDCIFCRLCELRCPDLAVTVLLSEEEDDEKND